MAVKKHRCKHCKEYFEETIKLQAGRFCGKGHAAEWALEQVKKKREKAKRVEIKERREKLKSKGDWAKEAQAAFNAYIRKRDEHLPCISCQRHHAGQYHAGHYRSVGGNPELRFESLNTHKQCMPCNSHLSGNLIDYRINLIKKIGQDAVDWLEGPHEPKRYTIEDLKELSKYYKAELKKLK